MLRPGLLLLVVLVLLLMGVGVVGVRQEVPPNDPIRGNTAASIDEEGGLVPLVVLLVAVVVLLVFALW